jgi:hypothetical protein
MPTSSLRGTVSSGNSLDLPSAIGFNNLGGKQEWSCCRHGGRMKTARI